MSDTDIRVTVAIPTHQRAGLLGRCLASVQAQDWPDLEIFVVDNASTDGTQDLCEAAAELDPRVRYVRHPKNLGALENFKYALYEASGEFFMWLSDDDWIDRSYVTRCATELLMHPGYALVGGRAAYYDRDRFLGRGESISLLSRDGRLRAVQYMARVVHNGMFSALGRRELILRTGYVQSRYGADQALIAAVAYLGQVETLDDVTLHREATGVSSDTSAMAAAIGVGGLHGMFPKAAIGLTVYQYVATESSAFTDLSALQREVLAIRCAASVVVPRAAEIAVACLGFAARWVALNLLAPISPPKMRTRIRSRVRPAAIRRERDLAERFSG